MQPKDAVTIVISSIALVVSIVSLVITLYQRAVEMRRSIRSQMTTLMIEIARNRSTEGESGQQTSSLIHRMIVLTRQASYLIEQGPKLITDVEYLTVAEGLWRVGDHDTADTYYRKGFDAATTPFMKVASKRGYANFLFSISKVSDGRKQYSEAVHLVDHSTDLHKSMIVHTYINWLETEVRHGFVMEAEQHYRQAKEVVNSIGNYTIKTATMAALDESKREHLPAEGLGQGLIRDDAPATPMNYIPANSGSTTG